jgi:hypothetical protein
VVYQPLSVEVRKQRSEKLSNNLQYGNDDDDEDAGSVELNPIEEVSQETDRNDQWISVTGKVMRYGRAVIKLSRYRDDLDAIHIHPLDQDDDDNEKM